MIFGLIMLLPHMFAAGTGCGSASNWLLGFPTWYSYLPSTDFDGSCNITNFNILSPQHPSDLLLVGLAITDIAFRVVGVLAFVYGLYGGFQYMTSQGEPDKLKNAQNTILNALIGTGIATVLAAGVAFAGHTLG